MKNLIRNGGFERGTIDFWTGYDCGAFGVTSVNPYKGTYAGLLEAQIGSYPYIMPNDYIELGVGEIAHFEAWLRPTDLREVRTEMVYYDENLDEVTTVTYENPDMPHASYTQVLWPVSGIEGAMYVRPKIKLMENQTPYMLRIDNVLMYKITPEEVFGRDIDLKSASAVSAAGTSYGEYFLVKPYREAVFHLYNPSLAGTSVTLDVSILSKTLFSEREYTIATFEQITSGGSSQCIVINEGIGLKTRVKAVIGGTPTAVTYEVTGLFNR